MLDDGTLKELEQIASYLAGEAGKVLLERFWQPLEVEYKGQHQQDPVTAADRASEAYLKQEISRRFPDHGIIAEETPSSDEKPSDFVWILDPLDGTTNYLNGLPLFGISVGVLHRGRPVVGALFTPSIGSVEGAVFHARVGGGAYRSEEAVHVRQDQEPGNGRLSALPAHFGQAYRFHKGLRQRLGEVRSTGSITYEMACVACGVFQYAIMGRPRIWDVAGGVVVIQEAGGAVLTRRKGSRDWVPLDRFQDSDTASSLEELRRWSAPVIAANPDIAAYVSQRIQRHSRLLPRLLRHLRRRAKETSQQHPEHRQDGTPPSPDEGSHIQGQGTSR